METTKQLETQNQTIRIIDPHNKPKQRLKGVKDLAPTDAFIYLWNNPKTAVYYPTEELAGYDIYGWLRKMANPQQIRNYSLEC